MEKDVVDIALHGDALSNVGTHTDHGVADNTAGLSTTVDGGGEVVVVIVRLITSFPENTANAVHGEGLEVGVVEDLEETRALGGVDVTGTFNHAMDGTIVVSKASNVVLGDRMPRVLGIEDLTDTIGNGTGGITSLHEEGLLGEGLVVSNPTGTTVGALHSTPMHIRMGVSNRGGVDDAAGSGTAQHGFLLDLSFRGITQ